MLGFWAIFKAVDFLEKGKITISDDKTESAAEILQKNFIFSKEKKGKKNLFSVYLQYLQQLCLFDIFLSTTSFLEVNGVQYTCLKTKLFRISIDLPEGLRQKCIYIAYLMNLSAKSDVEILFKQEKEEFKLVFMSNENKKIYNYSDKQIEFLFFPENFRPVSDFVILKKISSDILTKNCLFRLLPCGVAARISSHFGTKDMLSAKTRRRFCHPGIDLVTPDRSCKIVAAAGGLVSTAYNGNGLGKGYGKHVIIDHGANVQTLYGHLSDVFVHEKDQIGIGDELGTMGSTGLSTAPHLHFEIRIGGQKINPEAGVLGAADNEIIVEKSKPTFPIDLLKIFVWYAEVIAQNIRK